MKQFQYSIKDELGIHARPAGLLVQEAKRFSCNCKITGNGKEADLKRLFAVMGLGVKKGHEVEIVCTGDDEDVAAMALEAFMQANL